ncbi:MAG: ABC transporter ATP-binding protein [Clostridiales bacterium]|jgi:ABC-2 type transport system ATP-binding protein|nr:ABC transporter ATP-binding protein [Clostridiales bacterium]
MPDTSGILSLRCITKSYGINNVLRGLNLDLSAGQNIGIIGKNGSGKSTLLKIIIGLITRFGGSYDRAGKKLSALIETPVFIDGLTGRDNLYYLLEKQYVSRAIELVNLFGIGEYLDKTVRKYSLGMRHKLALSIVFAVDAEVILLDEPFNSLDFDAASHVIDLINDKRISGKSIVTVTHNISRIDDYCDKVFLLKDGVLKELSDDERIASEKYRLTFLDENGMKLALTLLGDYSVELNGEQSILIVVNRESLPIISKRLADCGLIGMVREATSIEKALYGEEDD